MNKSGDENRSVRSTKRRLREGLLALMQEKPVGSITVKELTALADMNRGTFYTHYSDVFDLLSSVEDEFFKNFSDRINVPVTTQEEFYIYMVNVFSFLGENKRFCVALMGTNGDMQFIERVRVLVDEKCEAFWQSHYPDVSRTQFEIHKAFLMSGLLGLIQHWFFNGLAETPELMAKVASDMIASCLK